jgi:hypothetical protein
MDRKTLPVLDVESRLDGMKEFLLSPRIRPAIDAPQHTATPPIRIVYRVQKKYPSVTLEYTPALLQDSRQHVIV